MSCITDNQVYLNIPFSKKELFKNKLRKSLDNNTYKLAMEFKTKYNNILICSSMRSNIWWKFDNHKWNRIDESYIFELISENFINEKLMNIDFTYKIINESKCLFFDSDFEEKLDSNVHLIGFNNGVYDLNNHIFRKGKYDDYISLSTKNDYIQFSNNIPYIEEIIGFFNQILPNEQVKNYFLQALSTCLSGETKEEKLYILTGCGSNGKSLTMDLMYLALGDYYMSCPITIITRKRGCSNETLPEKVRMKGKRCGVFQEIDDGEKLNVGVMKEFTGGDKILVRYLFKGATDMIEIKQQMKYFLTCNLLPLIKDNDIIL